jgi:hypothetical protein
MTRTRVILHGAVAVFTALGICGGQELRAQDEMSPVAGIVRIGEVEVVHGEGFDAGAGLYQGIVLAGANPPNFGPPPSWPCFTGGGTGPCANLAAGGLVIPFPAQVVPVKGVGEIVWTFTTTTATGTADLHVKVTQSGATIFTYSSSLPVVANGVWSAYVGNAKLSGAQTGTALVTVTTTVGTATITGRAILRVE